jgi:hypothetical protein
MSIVKKELLSTARCGNFLPEQLLGTRQTPNRTEVCAKESVLPGSGAKRGRMLKREKLALGSERISTTLSTLVLKT